MILRVVGDVFGEALGTCLEGATPTKTYENKQKIIFWGGEL